VRSLRLELLNMPKLATKYSRQIVESQVMIFTEMKVLYIFTSLAIWCVSGEEWGNGMGRVLCMVVGSLHRIIGCVGELSLLVISPCFVVQNNRILFVDEFLRVIAISSMKTKVTATSSGSI